jgi:DNA polymerase-3 subunit epsilon
MNRTLYEDQPIEELPLVFFDVETTGLAPAHGHRVCEIALLRVRGSVVEASYTTLVDPQRPLEARAFAVNGIGPDMLRGAPVFAAVADTLLALIDNAVLVAHNAPFDNAFLGHELRLLGYAMPSNPLLDTLILSQRLLLHRSSYSLGALSTDLGLHTPDHRAMSDVLALRGLFEHLKRLMSNLHIRTLDEVLRYQRGLLPGDPEPAAPPLIERAMREKRLLRIIYRSRSSLVSIERLVRPLELTLLRGQIYLRAYCYLRQDMRDFALKKIEAMRLDEQA